jgi:hypothetical protein
MLQFSSKQRTFFVRPEILILPLLSLCILIGMALPIMAAPIFRANSGGSQYTSSTTGTWNADSGYSSGSQVYGNSNAIANTADPTLYQSERWNNSFGYSVPVANGSYTLNLYFAEIYYTKSGQRIFNVAAQGQTVLSNFDIVAAAGGANRAIVKSFPVTVTNGVLSVNFTGVVGNAKISAIELVAATSIPPVTTSGATFRANSGGSQYASSTTGTWNADSSYSSGSQVYGNSNTITNTADPKLYQSERWNNSFGYSVPVANGSYTLNLYFAEIYYTKSGQRVFNVTAQGQTVLSNFDIVAAAGGANRAIVKSFPVTVTNGVLSVNFTGVVGNAKISAVELVAGTSAAPPLPTTTGVTFTQSQFEAAIAFDYEGENGILQTNPSQKSLGYPCGVPNSYSWKFGTAAEENIATAISGRGQQLAGAGYNQVYNACLSSNTRKSMPNARIEFTTLVVDYYSISQGKWVRAVQQSVGGAAFAEDFVNNQATGADFRAESQGHNSVRSGIGNAAGDAGSSTGRTVEDGSVGFNFHGFPNRFNINWADAQAVSVSQAMRCVPNSGTDVSDCNKLGYIANVGIDSWATTTSSYDNFATHGGVSGGRFKPVTADWQVFTNYAGPRNFAGIKAPPVPQF